VPIAGVSRGTTDSDDRHFDMPSRSRAASAARRTRHTKLGNAAYVINSGKGAPIQGGVWVTGGATQINLVVAAHAMKDRKPPS
jgi:hypothetical protein